MVLLAHSGLFSSSCQNEDEGWSDLLDSDLSQWEVYLSFSHTSLNMAELPQDSIGNTIRPVGLNNDSTGIFSVVNEGDDLVLKVTGEIYGCLTSLQEYENYHLKLKVKWGDKKWPPRLDEPRDTGILYHNMGPYGVDYWYTWKLSQELQIMEGGFGDYWSIGGGIIDVRARMVMDSTYIYDPAADLVSDRGNGGFCNRSENFEFPNGEWNSVELIVYEDKSVHIVNGHVVMTLENSRYLENGIENPLTKGAIAIQSEAAEAYYKDIKIKSIAALPAEVTSYVQ